MIEQREYKILFAITSESGDVAKKVVRTIISDTLEIDMADVVVVNIAGKLLWVRFIVYGNYPRLTIHEVVTQVKTELCEIMNMELSEIFANLC
jgi:hypothetical protein